MDLSVNNIDESTNLINNQPKNKDNFKFNLLITLNLISLLLVIILFSTSLIIISPYKSSLQQASHVLDHINTTKLEIIANSLEPDQLEYLLTNSLILFHSIGNVTKLGATIIDVEYLLTKICHIFKCPSALNLTHI